MTPHLAPSPRLVAHFVILLADYTGLILLAPTRRCLLRSRRPLLLPEMTLRLRRKDLAALGRSKLSAWIAVDGEFSVLNRKRAASRRRRMPARAPVGTEGICGGSSRMIEPLPILIENSIQIAWDYLERTGELVEPQVASSVLLTSAKSMVRLGERRRLMLSNRAIMDYKKYRDERNGLEVVA